MPIQEQLQDIPRTVLRTWLRAARLPLRAVEVVVHRGERDQEWPPVLAFESFEAQVKQLAGSALHDEELVAEGRLIQAKVAQLRKAAELETVAERREAIAAAKFEARRETAEQRRRRAEREATQRERALARDATAKKQQVARDAERKKQQAARADAATRKAVARQERTAASTRIAVERESLRKEKAAAQAKARAVNAERKIHATKATRRSAG
ncbi:MAG: hypothetical protein QOI55_2162 [Actinomycetota bacterium]|nr:hypothetical protein [Actinomycetota bacterium]